MPMRIGHSFDELRTARQLAREFGVPLHRIDYAVQRLGLEEAARVGIVRLFTAEQAEQVRSALRAIDARRVLPPTAGGLR
ncbi:MAG: hypothetical protein AB7Q17_12450 [Phycisphaerae bacterium]